MSSFVIDGEDARARITLGAENPELLGDDINSNEIDFNGVDIEATGSDVTVAAGVTISTRQIDGTDDANAPSTGNSGGITLSSSLDTSYFQGGAVTIGAGAKLYAQVEEGSAFDAGDISISADNTLTLPNAPIANLLAEGGHVSRVAIREGVTILGGTIDIESTAGILPLTTGMSAAAAGVTSGALGLLSPLTGLLSLPLAIQVSIVNAVVEIGADNGDDVTIQGSGHVTIAADATASAQGDAIMWFNPVKSKQQYGFAVGVWVAKAESDVTLSNNVAIESTGSDVAISANSTTTAGGAARVSQNLQSQVGGFSNNAPDNPNNIAVAIGVSSTTTNAFVTVAEGASVIADMGNVAITTGGTETVKIYPETRSYKDGQFGATLALEFATADIRTTIHGEVRAGGAEVGTAITFDPFTTLDTTANTINLGEGHGYQTGDKILYSAGLGGPIDGLDRLANYYVIVVEGSSSLIQLAASEGDAQAGAAINFRDNPMLSGGGQSLAFSQVGDVSDSIDYGFAHGFTQGEAVVYTAAEGKRVGGLVDGETYYVVLVDGDDSGSLLQLATDAAGTNIVDLDASPIFTVESTGQILTVASVEQGPSVITLTEDHGLSAGDAIVFHPALGFQLIDPLTETRYAEGTVFYAIPSPSADDPTQLDPMQIRLALTQADAQASNGYTNAVPLQIDGSLMLGTDHTITPTVAKGITATSTMTGSHILETKARIGGNESIVKKNSRPEFAGTFFGFSNSFYDEVQNPQLDDAANNNGPAGDNADTSSKSFELAASLGYLQVHRTVETIIDGTAVLKSGADILIGATATESGNVIIESGVAEGENSKVKVAIGASIAVANDNTTNAIIASGAEINQDEEFRSDDQSVTVNAETEMQLVNMAGVFDFGFGIENLFANALQNMEYANIGEKLKKYKHPLIQVGAQAENSAAGASFQWIDVTNRTLASIGGTSPVASNASSGQPASVHSGANGRTSVTAHDELWHFSFVDSGAKTTDGKFAFAGSGAVFRYNPKDNGHTTAMIGSGTVITGGSLNVKATNEVILVGQNGDFITGDSTGSIGVGLTYQELYRRVRAYIGDLNGISTTASDIQLDGGATINVEAESSGYSVSFVLAGTVRTDPPPADNDDGQQNAPAQGQDGNGSGANTGKSGWALAGDASVIDIQADQVLAFIDDIGTISADKVTVSALNDNSFINLAGAFSVVKTDYDSNSNTGLAGSFSGIELHRGDADALGRYDTIAAAVGGYDITFTDGNGDGSEVAPPGSVPSVNTGDGELTADDPVWTKKREAVANYADIRGVAVNSNVSETVNGFVVAAGVGDEFSVNIGTFVPMSTRNTVAYVAGQVNQGEEDVAGTTQNIVVTASTDFHSLGVVVPFSGSKDVAAAPGVNWISANLTTEAYIDDGAQVSAGGDIAVVAAATQHVTRITIGVAATASQTAEVAVEASITGLYLTTTTTAEIHGGTVDDPTRVAADGNVLVSATDETTSTGVAGGIAVVLSEDGLLGAGAGVVSTYVGKTTTASIGSMAHVDAAGNGTDEVNVLNGDFDAGDKTFDIATLVGVAVQAQSSETLTNFGVAAAGAAGLGAAGLGAAGLGVAGGVSYTNVVSDTTATIGAGAMINQGDEQSSASGQQSVNVSASNVVTVLDVGGGLAVGTVAISGAVDVGIIRNSTTASIEADAVIAAKKDVAAYALAIRDAKSYAVNVGLGQTGIGGSVSVWLIGDALDSNYDTAATSNNNGLEIQDKSDSSDPGYSSFDHDLDGQSDRSDTTNAVNGFSKPKDQADGNENQTYFLGIRDQVKRTVNANSDAQSHAARNAINASDTADTAGVTEAVIAGTVTAGGNVIVGAREDNFLRFALGSVEGSATGPSLGAGIGVATIKGAALAHIDGTITAVGDVEVFADQHSHLDGLAFIVEVSNLPAFGAGIAIINDHSVQEVSIRDGAEILQASSIAVSANHDYSKFETLAVEVQLSIIGTVGASIARSAADGSTMAFIGDATLGDPTAQNATIGDVTVEAFSDIRPKATAYSASGGVLASGDGNQEVAIVEPTVAACIASPGGTAADNPDVTTDTINRIAGDVTIAANSTAEPRAIGVGVAVSVGLSIPVTLPRAEASPTVEAYVGANTILNIVGNGNDDPDQATGRLEISAISADDPHAVGTAAGGSLISGGGTGVFAKNFTELKAYIGDDSQITTHTDVLIKAEQEYVGYARGQGGDFGGFAVNVNEATLEIEPTVTAYIGSARATATGDVIIESESGTPGSLPDLSFDLSVDVDYDTNQITFSRPHGLETGESIVYRANEHAAIGGLEDGSTYQVIRVSDTTIQLGTIVSADQVNNETGEIEFDLPHLFENGSAVVYDANGNPWINGLRNGVKYFINALDSSSIKLAPTVEIASNESIAAFNGKNAVDYSTNEITLPVSYPLTGDSLSFGVLGVPNGELITTLQESTSLQVGDAVMYAPNANALQVKPLERFGVYYISHLQTNAQEFVQVALAETPGEAALGNRIHFTEAGAGDFVGVDVESWQVAGAGVNAPGAFVFSEQIFFDSTDIQSFEPFPFVTGDQVSWVRSDGNYADNVRLGLLPFITYYFNVEQDGDLIIFQLAKSLEDLENQKFITLTEPASFASDPSESNFFLALQIPAKTGDGFTYRAPPAVSFSGEDINIPGTEAGDPIATIRVTNGDKLNTLLLDLPIPTASSMRGSPFYFSVMKPLVSSQEMTFPIWKAAL